MQFLNLMIIIQARMTSTRLPGKVMKPLCGKTVLEIIFDRLECFHANLIIATTDDGSEYPIVELCQKHGVRFFRGDTDNVLERYYKAAAFFGAQKGDTIVRITSDCPLIDPDILRLALERHRNIPESYVCVDIISSYPRGMDAEVFDFSYLEEAHLLAVDLFHREHVTPYIRAMPIRHEHLTHDSDHSRFRLTLDTPEDYEMITALYTALGCRTDFDYPTLIQTLEHNPHIAAMNAHVLQKTP